MIASLRSPAPPDSIFASDAFAASVGGTTIFNGITCTIVDGRVVDGGRAVELDLEVPAELLERLGGNEGGTSGGTQPPQGDPKSPVRDGGPLS